uniref:Fatty-acid and retinol-binding protein 1 n=1 Tax=Steinernema glaseri TaxID=37863 RepID=A0A1I7Z8J7_9BILA
LALIPTEIVDFYKSFTPEENQIEKELSEKVFRNIEEYDNALKEKSESLYSRVQAIRDLMKAKVGALDTEAKTFFDETLNAIILNHPADGKSYDVPKLKETVINKYQALSAEAKANLQKQFPQMTALLKNKKFRKIIPFEDN